jgi:hypothetical protein
MQHGSYKFLAVQYARFHQDLACAIIELFMRQNHGLLNDSACAILMKPGILDREELVRTAVVLIVYVFAYASTEDSRL